MSAIECVVLLSTYSQVQGVFIDTRAASAPANLLPRHKPLLHHIQAKDPVERENCGYVNIIFTSFVAISL